MTSGTAQAAPEFPDEVVTSARVRYVQLPGVERDVALITLDNGFDHTKPSSFGPGGLTSLDRALDEVEAHGVAAIAVTGKPFIFVVGADITGMPKITAREQALEIGRLGHRVFRRLNDSAVPTFALVNGAAIGGGLEIALQCHYRTLARNAAPIALTECFLGLVPGWGGTQLLPNLIGADNAVTVIVENPLNQNKMLNAAQAAELGIFDVVFDSADFLEQSLLWAARVITGELQVTRPEVERGEAWAAAVARGRALVDAKLHGAAPAPSRALDLIELAERATLDEGFAAENDALADLIMTEELRAGLYSFDLVQRRAKRPVGVPNKSLARPVTKVGVVGAGLMASQLALLFARKLEVPVVLTDLDQARLDKGVGYVHDEIDKLLTKKRISPEAANRLKALVTGSLSKDAFADADAVIEAVFEDLTIKQKVFAEVEAVVSDTCLLLTNTSSLSVTDMASQLAHPERVVGFHFFNPVAVLPLLEVVRAQATDDPSLATAFVVAKKLGKKAVLVSDRPAFVVNRILTRFLGEVTRAVDE
ncbi:MAG: 3-hydroxyacyl-CoA dehydrogenase NAD-binding domain-containing protein, partial [Nocardioidaceae bacterium]